MTIAARLIVEGSSLPIVTNKEVSMQIIMVPEIDGLFMNIKFIKSDGQFYILKTKRCYSHSPNPGIEINDDDWEHIMDWFDDGHS